MIRICATDNGQLNTDVEHYRHYKDRSKFCLMAGIVFDLHMQLD
jgi:hypothetical protein